jgi:SAM-dependent methyltransferase
MRALLRPLLKRLPPERRRRLARPALLGTLRRLTPLSERWGSDRGRPIDRYFIESFLALHATDIRGDVLEVKDADYTRRFGTAVTRCEILDVDPANREATILADLAAADAIPGESFDCVIVTQTLQYIRDVAAAVEHIHRILRPGGVTLVTVPVVSRVVGEGGLDDYWRFTAQGCRALFDPVFGDGAVEVESNGNVLVSIAFLTGMASEELRERELASTDPRFAVIVCVRAVKRHSGRAT